MNEARRITELEQDLKDLRSLVSEFKEKQEAINDNVIALLKQITATLSEIS